MGRHMALPLHYREWREKEQGYNPHPNPLQNIWRGNSIINEICKNLG